MRRAAVLVHAAVLGTIVACGMPDGDYFGRIDRAEPGHFRWCNQAEPDHLDPVYASSTASVPIVNALFDGLMAYGDAGEPEPSLAASVDAGSDLRTFAFHLRDGAAWSTGRAVTAYDVAYTALRVLTPELASPNADNLAPIRNAPAFVAKRVFVLRRALAPYRAGDVVELAGSGDAEPPGDPGRYAAGGELALRDLGAAADAAYARVPAGGEVHVLATTGERIAPPSPDGARWVYVMTTADAPLGWVPAADLGAQLDRDVAFRVRGVALADGGDEATDGDGVGTGSAERAEITAFGRDLARSPDALGIAIPDAHTIAFATTDPTPWFLALAASRALRTTPTEAVSRAPTAWTAPDRIVTSGPLELAEWLPRDRIELRRAAHYWNPGDVHVDRVSVLPVDDQAAAANLYVTGACDATATNAIPASYLPALSGDTRGGRPYKDYVASPYLGIYFLWLNTDKLPNRHLRRALALAIDRSGVPRFTHGGEVATSQFTPGTPIARLSPADLAACGATADTPGVALVQEPGALCYLPPPGLDYDVAAARAEVAAARAELGAAFPRTLSFRYNAGEVHAEIAEYLQAQWAAIGVDVELEAEEWNALLADTRDGKFEIARFAAAGSVPDTESDFLPLLRCGAPDNRGRYCNHELEWLLDAARAQPDRRARNATLRAAEGVALADAPVIPLYVYTQKHLIKPYVHGYATNLVDQPALWRVSIGP
jgi:oligopeptide transport system substrate-binding protein|nr:peptide ABC transporter substrate-binding protein [Kofleriaceae bacterium]